MRVVLKSLIRKAGIVSRHVATGPTLPVSAEPRGWDALDGGVAEDFFAKWRGAHGRALNVQCAGVR